MDRGHDMSSGYRGPSDKGFKEWCERSRRDCYDTHQSTRREVRALMEEVKTLRRKGAVVQSALDMARDEIERLEYELKALK